MGKMNTAKIKAYAKLNLTLDVTGEEDGYHLIDSLVVSVDLFDKIVVKKRRDSLVSVTMRGMGSESIPPEHNNAQKAGERFVARFGTAGADITVYKNIPMGAGLGGSSADAAGVLGALAVLYGVKDGAALKQLADGLGSDTGYMLTGGFARISGRGEKVTGLGELPVLHFLLICPESGVSTAECYRLARIRTGRTRTERVLEEIGRGNLAWAAKLFGNDLYECAESLNDEVRQALTEAKSFSPLGVGMTGSGSGVFALFETEELADWAKSRYRGKFRVYRVKSIDPAKKKSRRNPFALGEGDCGDGGC